MRLLLLTPLLLAFPAIPGKADEARTGGSVRVVLDWQQLAAGQTPPREINGVDRAGEPASIQIPPGAAKAGIDFVSISLRDGILGAISVLP